MQQEVFMEPLTLLGTALKNGKGLYNFAQGGEFYLLLNELAGLDGNAASKAIGDSAESKYPLDQLNQAETLLRLAYEKYSKAARPSFFRNIIGTVVEPSGPLKSRNKALLNAATTALTTAEVTRLAANPPIRKIWLSRAKGDFYLYETRAKPGWSRPEPPSNWKWASYDDKMMYLNLQSTWDVFDRNIAAFNGAYSAQERLPDLERPLG
jgi:hypothetical protein